MDAASSDVVIDGRGLVIFTSGDGTISAWDPDGTLRVGRALPRPPAPKSKCTGWGCLVIDPTGTVAAVPMGDGTVGLADARSMEITDTLPGTDGPQNESALAFFSGGRRLAAGGLAGSVTIWDVKSHAVVRRLRFAEPVQATAVSPDGSLIAVQQWAESAPDTRVEVRDLASGRTLYTRTVRSGPGGIAFSGDGGSLVASGCCDDGSTLAGWDARTGAERFRRAVKSRVEVFAMSPVGRTLAVGAPDGNVTLRDASTGRERATIRVAGSSIEQLAISPDGRMFAASPSGTAVTLWDVRSRKRVGDGFPRNVGWIPGVGFHPNGRLLLYEPTTVVEWPTDGRTLKRAACRIVGRDLTRVEWSELVPNRPYRRVCQA
jgi:WD40 repeat protein